MNHVPKRNVALFRGCSTSTDHLSDLFGHRCTLEPVLSKLNPPKLRQFTPEHSEVFQFLNDDFMSAPISSLTKLGLSCSMDPDSCDSNVGCTLFQTILEGDQRPIGYWSRSLHVHERYYFVSEKKCLAAMWALSTLRPYVMGGNYVV